MAAKGRPLVTDDVLGVVSLAESGLGFCQSYDFIVRDKLERGRLVKVLKELAGRTRSFSIIYLPHRQLSPASQSLLDFLTTATSAVIRTSLIDECTSLRLGHCHSLLQGLVWLLLRSARHCSPGKAT
ncbi:LysR substrate binding domain protein [compost metagenome]